LLLLFALASILVVVLVGLFVFLQGYPLLAKTGFFTFLTGLEWLPGEGIFGILPMVIGTLAVTLGALIIGVPLGVTTAVFLAEYASERIAFWTRRAVELLAGIPSVVYGLFGMTVIVPLVRHYQRLI
jgi:phosphate transport system permease protein